MPRPTLDLQRRVLHVERLGRNLLLVCAGEPPPAEPRREALATLTPAERSTVELAARGLTNRAIAALRGASMSTVANQLTSGYRKLGVGSRRQLGAFFRSDARPTLEAEPEQGTLR
jgi:DNA-binding NarL/FixJ family response regulator